MQVGMVRFYPIRFRMDVKERFSQTPVNYETFYVLSREIMVHKWVPVNKLRLNSRGSGPRGDRPLHNVWEHPRSDDYKVLAEFQSIYWAVIDPDELPNHD